MVRRDVIEWDQLTPKVGLNDDDDDRWDGEWDGKLWDEIKDDDGRGGVRDKSSPFNSSFLWDDGCWWWWETEWDDSDGWW